MKSLIKLVVVTYRLENSRIAKAKFYTFEDDVKHEKYYKIINETENVDKIVSKDEGNDYYKQILQHDKNAFVNRVV